MPTGYPSPRAKGFTTQRSVAPKGEGYGARIGDTWVRLAAAEDHPLRYFTKDSLAPRQDSKAQVGTNVLDIGDVWARTELDGGQGLDWDPRELPADQTAAANDVRRFWDSKNIDISAPPAGVPYASKLSHTFEQFDTSTLHSVGAVAASVNHVFISELNTIHWYNAWNDASHISSQDLASRVVMLAASPGDAVMAITADGDIWYRGPGEMTFSKIVTSDFRAVWFVKGRFVAYRPGRLGEILPDGTFVLFDTTGEYDVTAVVSTGPSIVASVTDGTLRSYVPEQANQVDPDSVSLVIRGRTDLPEGEVPYSLGSMGSVLTVLTIADDTDLPGKVIRFYSAEALSSQYDYVVGGLQLRREWFGAKDAGSITANMATTREAIWFSVTEDDDTNHVWRFDLTTFGLSRHSATFDAAHGVAIATFKEKLAVINDSDGFLYLETDTYHLEGYVISPNLTLGLNTDIAWVASVLEASSLSGLGVQIELWRSTNPEAILDPIHRSWVHVTRLSSDSQSGVELPMLGVSSRTLALQIRFSSTDGSETPLLTRVAVRGIPTHRDWIVHLPVNTSDYVEVPGRMPLHVPGLGDDLQYEMLNMVGKHVELVVLDPPLLFRGVVDNVEEPVTYISKRGSASVLVMMQFRGLRATTTLFPTGDAGLGLGLLGVATLGIGQTET